MLELPDSWVWDFWFADAATWTGSVVRRPDGRWHMFYTGASVSGAAFVQSIGLATSDDLVTWHKHPDNPVTSADPRWYETYDGRSR